LGQYEIVATLAQAAWERSNRAKDGKLKREVALQVWPDVFANDPERMARFQRESR
jgi:hypothetical protein